MGGDGAFVEEFVGFDRRGGFGDDFLQQLDVAVPEFGVVRLVCVDVELLCCANRSVDGEVLPLTV